MSMIEPLSPDCESAEVQKMLEGIRSKYGVAPNLMRTMAHSEAALQGYLSFCQSLGRDGGILPKLREQLSIAVAEANGSEYCLAAHTAIGRAVGLSERDLDDARRGRSADPQASAALGFARRLADGRGRPSDDDLDLLRGAGFSEGEIVELIALVCLNIYVNYLGLAARVEVDFPPARPPREPAEAAGESVR